MLGRQPKLYSLIPDELGSIKSFMVEKLCSAALKAPEEDEAVVQEVIPNLAAAFEISMDAAAVAKVPKMFSLSC